jgi:type IV secretion system protein VirB4
MDVERLGASVDHVMVSGIIPREFRSITAIMHHLPHPARTNADQKASLVELLKPWCQGGEHGWLFDNPSDLLDLSTHDAYGFDLTEFIAGEDQPAPPSRTPLLMYLFYRVRQSIDGTRRVINVFDEFAQYLDDHYMDLEIKRGLKTDRKKDCIYVFATQEPNDALDSRIGKTIMQSDPGDYLNGLKLTPSEYRALLEIPEHSRQFLFKQGNQSTIASMVLPDMEREISILSGTPDNADRLERIMAAVGPNPDVWLPLYWREVLKEGV